MFRRLFSFLTSKFCGARQPARAFNGAGHMTVANLTYQRLNPRTKQRVYELLKLNPYFERWLATVPADVSEEERQLRILMQASMWADDIKRDKNYVNDRIDESRQDLLNLQDASDYSDMRMHKYWHYVNYPFSNDGTELPPIVTPNLETQLDELRAVIAADGTDGQKSYAMTWLLHLIGDVHQPLHTVARVSQSEKGGDLGGNKVFIIVNGRNSRLHFFWDDVLGMEKQTEHIMHFAKKLPAEDPDQETSMNTHDWVMESFDACRQLVYTPPIGEGSGPFTITNEYRDKAKAFAEKRIAISAVRLANVLNQELQ